MAAQAALDGVGSINPPLVFYFRMETIVKVKVKEEKFAGGKFREIPFAVDIIFAGGKFRAKSKFAKIAKINSTRKIELVLYSTPVTWRSVNAG